MEPNDEFIIIFSFKSDNEIRYKSNFDNSDIKLNILEGTSLSIVDSVSIPVIANCVFSKYSIAPLKSINFGPLQFEESRKRIFEIRNNGLFEFIYDIREMGTELDEVFEKTCGEIISTKDMTGGLIPGLTKEVKDTKKVEQKQPTTTTTAINLPNTGKTLDLTEYSIVPARGTIPPNSKAEIEVTFKALLPNNAGSQMFIRTLACEISNRDYNDYTSGVP